MFYIAIIIILLKLFNTNPVIFFSVIKSNCEFNNVYTKKLKKKSTILSIYYI